MSQTRPKPDGAMWVALAAVAVTALTGMAVGLLRLPTGAGIAAIVAMAVVAGALVALGWARRRRAVLGLEEEARALLTPEFPPRTTRGRSTSAELSGLEQTLAHLSERVREQLKDVAKKGRNFEALIDAIDEPILATDSEERVLVCNRAAESLLGAESGRLAGRAIRDVFTQARIIEMHEAARAGRTLREQLPVTTPLGQRIFHITATPLPAAWGGGVFGSVLALRDVTELAQAVQVKTDFVANASHELRTPVAAIRAAAETLQNAADDPTMAARLCGMILSHAQRLEEMLRDLLDLSRLESPEAEVKIAPVDMSAIERAIRSLSEEVCTERSLQLTFEIDPRAGVIETDGRMLTLMLRNLVENATKFAHEETTVRVVASLADAGAPGGQAVLRMEVIDRGIGIPLQHQERVFERYYQVDPGRSAPAGGGGARRGTGLGLAIVKHAAKALGGRAGLTSVWGRGTTAFIEIPVGLVSERAETGSSAHSGERSTGR